MESRLLRYSTLTLTFIMPLCSAIPGLTGLGRSIGEQSAQNDTVLVPLGFAFAIWGPIFLGLILFGFYQLKSERLPNGSRMAIAVSMTSTSLWALAASFAPNAYSSLLTAGLFIPIVLFALKSCSAIITMCDANKNSGRAGKSCYWLAAVPVAAFAGWCSLAMFLNWAQVFITGPLHLPFSETIIAIVILIAAVSFLAWTIQRMRGFFSFYFPIAWGLALLAYARFFEDKENVTIAVAALVGLFVITYTMLKARKTRSSS